MLLAPKEDIIYGPVRSRRLGRSLGVNILPAKKKVCSFNCLYCQYGWQEGISAEHLDRVNFPRVSTILAALAEALEKAAQPPQYITFSGNGEATLHPGFAAVVEGIIETRDRLAPQAKTAILSNASAIQRADIREVIARLDEPIMKLDAGQAQIFQAYNRPAPGIVLEEIVQGLAALKKVTIQTLFTGGPQGNCTEKNLSAWIKQLKRISPRFVQVYSLDRASPTDAISKLDKTELLVIQSRLQAENIPCAVF